MTQFVQGSEPIGVAAKKIARRVFRHENTVLILALIALIGGMGVVTGGKSITRTNMMNVLLQSSIRGVASVGQAFVLLTAGIDVSVGGIGRFCGLLGTMMMTEGWQNIVGYPVSVFLAIPVMLLVGAAWGAINGSLVSRVGMPALIVTLGMWEVTSGAAFRVSRGQSIMQLPRSLAFIGQGHIAGVPVPVVVFVAVAVVAYFVLNHTTFGRSVYAAGGNPLSAWLSGIKVRNIQFIVYVISGFLAGLAAAIMAGRVMAASMRTLEGLEIDSIAAVCIGGISLAGGRGSIIGVVIGVLIIGVVNNGLSVLGAGPDLQRIVKGVIIIIAVAVDYIRRR